MNLSYRVLSNKKNFIDRLSYVLELFTLKAFLIVNIKLNNRLNFNNEAIIAFVLF